jgi:hypothetical protein
LAVYTDLMDGNAEMREIAFRKKRNSDWERETIVFFRGTRDNTWVL